MDFEYCKEFLNEDFPNKDPTPPDPIYGPIPKMELVETKEAIANMKNQKTMDSDEIPSDLSLSSELGLMLNSSLLSC